MPSTKDKELRELYKPLKGLSFYLTGRVKAKYEGKIKKNCGIIRDSWTPRTKYIVCSKAEYYSFRSRIAGDVGDKVELPDEDYNAIENAYRDSTKRVLNTGCLDAISDNSHKWKPVDWADAYEREEPETRFDFWIQEMQTHGVHRLASLLDEAIEIIDEENTNFEDRYNDTIAIIRDVQKVAGTLVQDETPVQDETWVRDEGYESAE